MTFDESLRYCKDQEVDYGIHDDEVYACEISSLVSLNRIRDFRRHDNRDRGNRNHRRDHDNERRFGQKVYIAASSSIVSWHNHLVVLEVLFYLKCRVLLHSVI